MSINTTMTSAQTVYYGPGTSTYPSAGSVSAGESITAYWIDGNWCYIQYRVGSTNNYKRGYVSKNALTSTNGLETFASVQQDQGYTPGTRYVNSACTVYFGPGTSTYPSAGSLSYGEAVTFLAVKENNYAFIEYAITNTAQKKRAWANTNYFTITAPTSKVFVDPTDPTQIFTRTSHADYSIVKGTPVYAMCDGTFNAAYWLGQTASTGGATAYVSLGIGGHLIPASGWKASDGRTSTSIEYGHCQSLEGYSCPSFNTYAENSYPSSSSQVTNLVRHDLGSKTVKCGDLIGYSGNTGNSSNSHLHIKL